MTPELRFPGFEGVWTKKDVGSLLRRASQPVAVDPVETYQEIGVRSHGRGVFHKEPTTGVALGDKRVFHVVPGTLVFNIVFAWEQAVAMLSEDEAGMIASHRFPMFRAREGEADLAFLRTFFLTGRGRQVLEIASPGGAGRNRTLGAEAFLDLRIPTPNTGEQRKIAAFLDTVGRRIALAERRRDGLKDYKRGLMQALFTRRLRFRRDDGSAFPEWTEHRLGELVSFSKGRGVGKDDISLDGAQACIRYGEIYTTYGERITQIASRTEASPDLLLSAAGDIIMPSSGEDAGDMARACAVMLGDVALGGDIIVLRGAAVPVFLAHYLTHARRGEIARLGQGNSVVHIYAVHLAEIEVHLPHPDEQAKIADALIALDDRIAAANVRLNALREWRRGLLQKMFVR